MESVGTLADEMRAKLAGLAEKAAENDRRAEAQHQQMMAGLPPGTCERCYGRGGARVAGVLVPCRDCSPLIVVADGVPYEFHSASLDNYREDDGNRTALAKARAFTESSRDLYLTGGVGAGKTRLACSILNDHVRRRRTGYFARVPWMLHELQPGRDSTELELRLVTTSLLVFDDIAAERDQATDYTRRTLLMLYEQRHDRGLRTIFTSNKTLQELQDMQDDERLASRIAGRADAVKLTTADQRLLRRVK
jgi:DNA replication protein DnaC